MDDRIQYGATGGAATVSLWVASWFTRYRVASAILVTFLLSIFGLLLLAILSYEDPPEQPTAGGSGRVGPMERGSRRSGFSIPHTRKVLVGFLGSTAVSTMGGLSLFLL